jgi:chemosensory pili system protein ChpA (sensor histidine kinase/response regulator)
MVGLKAFGEAAWECEQLLNTQLAEQRAAELALLEFADWVLGYLDAWADDIAAKRLGDHNEREVQIAASKLSGTSGGEAPSDIALPIGFPVDLPSRQDLDLRAPDPVAKPAQLPAEEPEDLSFELDLSNLDPLVEPGSAPRAAPDLPVPTPADASAMFDRFDDARSADMQTTLSNEEFDAARSTFVDLYLSSPGEASASISAAAKQAARRAPMRPAPSISRSTPAPRSAARRSATSTSRWSVRYGSAFRSSTSTSTRPTSCRAAS